VSGVNRPRNNNNHNKTIPNPTNDKWECPYNYATTLETTTKLLNSWSSEIVVDTNNNIIIDGDEGVNVVAPSPWIRGGLVKTVLKNLFFIYLL
jgi:hypothetical protein